MPIRWRTFVTGWKRTCCGLKPCRCCRRFSVPMATRLRGECLSLPPCDSRSVFGMCSISRCGKICKNVHNLHAPTHRQFQSTRVQATEQFTASCPLTSLLPTLKLYVLDRIGSPSRLICVSTKTQAISPAIRKGDLQFQPSLKQQQGKLTLRQRMFRSVVFESSIISSQAKHLQLVRAVDFQPGAAHAANGTFQLLVILHTAQHLRRTKPGAAQPRDIGEWPHNVPNVRPLAHRATHVSFRDVTFGICAMGRLIM